MKQSPHEKHLLANLGPSKFSAEGFLGNDDRSLDEIIAVDSRILKDIGIEKSKLVAALKNAYEKTKKGMGGEVEIAPDVVGVFHESRGEIPSPFPHEGTFEKGDAEITHKKTGEKIFITSLSIHLIDKHDFFQGKGSHFRIEPHTAAKLFGLIT